MGVVKSSEVVPTEIAPGRKRYLAHTDSLMMVVMDFDDGPSEQPDSPHSHPHEQITYVVDGRVEFHLGETMHTLEPGDMITVPPGRPHTVRLLTGHVRLIDTFHPLREEFL